jgi:hypothetical protein
VNDLLLDETLWLYEVSSDQIPDAVTNKVCCKSSAMFFVTKFDNNDTVYLLSV